MTDSSDLQSYPAGVERGTSIDDSSNSCSPSSRARWMPGPLIL